jgi:nucleolar GTP-binding protein
MKGEGKEASRVEPEGPRAEKNDFDSPILTKTNEPASTGAFQKFPMVAPSYELIESALKRAERVGYNKKLKNEGARAKNRAARQLDTLMKELTGPLGRYETGFVNVDQLHPFERALLELTIGEEQYTNSVHGVKALRKSVVGIAKGYAARCSKAPTKKEALDLRDEGFANVDSTYKRQAYILDQLKEVAKSLRQLPVVDPKLPTIALVGAPNVGKSSLVQLLSSGLPEVQNYPFTTRSIKMGHFYVNSRRHQVTDTPGILCRPEEDRNAMEKLTLASLEHLPTSVLFVMDLTGECGTSLLHQWKIRQELKERFPGKIWIDVFSKADLLLADFAAADRDTAAMLSENGNDANISDELSAKDVACLIPGARRVSSLTGDGIEELKADMLCMLDSDVVV